MERASKLRECNVKNPTKAEIYNNIKETPPEKLDLYHFQVYLFFHDPGSLNFTKYIVQDHLASNERINFEGVHKFCEEQKTIIDKEIDACNKSLEDLKSKPESQIDNLKIEKVQYDKGKRNLITFSFENLKQHKNLVFEVGNSATLFPVKKECFVQKIDRKYITISIDEEAIDFKKDYDKVFRLVLDETLITYYRLKSFLQWLESEPKLGRTIGVLLNQLPPSQIKLREYKFKRGLSSLTEAQKRAILSGLSCEDIVRIHGPPATGKTQVLREIISILASEGKRILVCANSNTAVDNFIPHIMKQNIVCCRLGNPEKSEGVIKDIYEDNLVKTSYKLQNKYANVEYKFERALKDRNKWYLIDEIKKEKLEIDQLRKDVAKFVINQSQVVFCTLALAGDSDLDYCSFDYVIIDECAQAIELACWVAISKGKRVIVAGDEMQLPPIIKNTENIEKLSNTLFEKLGKSLPKENCVYLDLQFRMNDKIWEWPKKHVYNEHAIVHSEKLCKDWVLKPKGWMCPPVLLLIDTKGKATESKIGTSKENAYEAALTVCLMEELISNYKINCQSQIGIISPYTAQTKLINSVLSKRLYEKDDSDHMYCNTVDSYQGQEKDAMILSLTSLNGTSFFTKKRVNVAVTRAKRFLAVICDVRKLLNSQNDTLKSLVQYFDNVAVKKSEKDYPSFEKNLKRVKDNSTMMNTEEDDKNFVKMIEESKCYIDVITGKRNAPDVPVDPDEFM